MSVLLGNLGRQLAISRAARLNARERLSSLAGFPELFRTLRIPAAAGVALPATTIDTGEAFADRTRFVTFSTSIRILANAGVHRGLVFEFGDDTRGCALWVGDETIGFHAGAAGDADGATALFDLGAELPPGREFLLTAAVRTGDGRVRLWGNGIELARAQASNGDFGTPAEWSSDGAGSFASNESGTAVTDVPAGSSQAPDGFEVIAPLSVYFDQVPRHFV